MIILRNLTFFWSPAWLHTFSFTYSFDKTFARVWHTGTLRNLYVIRSLIWGNNYVHAVACWFHCWENSTCFIWRVKWSRVLLMEKWKSLILVKNHPMTPGFSFSSKSRWASSSVSVPKTGAPSWSLNIWDKLQKRECLAVNHSLETLTYCLNVAT